MVFLISCTSALFPMSCPPIEAVPLVFEMRQVSIRTVVVFPAPLGPRNPKTSPSSTRRVSASTAVTSPNFLVRPSISINEHYQMSRDEQNGDERGSIGPVGASIMLD